MHPISSSSTPGPDSVFVRHDASPGDVVIRIDDRLDLKTISGRDDHMPFLQSADGMKITAYVAGSEVPLSVAQSAGALTINYVPRYFWRGQPGSASTHYANIYAPEDNAGSSAIYSGVPPFYPTGPSQGQDSVSGEKKGDEQARYNQDNEWQRPASTLSLPIGDLAMCYFASNFVLIPRRPFGGSFFEFIVPVLQGQPPDSSVQYALRACAFSALGNRWVSDTVDFHAIGISQYTAALAKTTQNLKNPRLRTTDATLATVLLMGLFESITAKKEMFAWRSHIEGAVQIVQSRGPGRIRTRVEKLLFNSVRMQLIYHTMTADSPPTWNINWWSGENILDSATLRSQRFLMETAQIRRELDRYVKASAGQQAISHKELSMYMLRVRAIDSEMAAFLASLPHECKPYTRALAGDVPDGDYENAEAYPGRVDMYPDISMATVWVGIRSCRLVMSCSIVRCLALTCPPGTDYRTLPECIEETRRCKGLVDDVVAAVPYFLGSVPSMPPISNSRQGTVPQLGPTSASAATSGFACGDDHGHGMPKVLAAYLLIWPLAGAYTHDCATPTQRLYMAGRFKYMGNVLGLRYALLCVETPFRFPSMFMYRDRLIVTGSPANSPPSDGASTASSLPYIGLGRSPANFRASPER
ncbi:uncharacterized protein SPSK_02323 [Sporothrix schenckii 1099-18]|nr:uncharacterized protein SPSK_02323 [Sporothrix schenckii 1099-18]KJR86514.1 hypothetical protein SPSK_02323 [Sporothrix schenckii 1099-18]